MDEAASVVQFDFLCAGPGRALRSAVSVSRFVAIESLDLGGHFGASVCGRWRMVEDYGGLQMAGKPIKTRV